MILKKSISLSKRFGSGFFACTFSSLSCVFCKKPRYAFLDGCMLVSARASEKKKTSSFHFQSLSSQGSVRKSLSIYIQHYHFRICSYTPCYNPPLPFPSGRRETLINGHIKHDLFLWPAPLSSHGHGSRCRRNSA